MTDYLNPPPLPSKALTPNSTSNDVLGVVEILSLVTDPEAHKKRLDELQNVMAEADRKIAEAKVASEKRRTAENMFAEAAKILADRKTAAAKLDARTSDLDRREKELIDREGKLKRQIEEHRFDAEEQLKVLDSRQEASAAREKENEQERQKLVEDRAEIERQKAHVREFSAKFAG